MTSECPIQRVPLLEFADRLGAGVRHFGPRIAAGVSDQALYSGANAAIAFALSLWLSVEEYGVYCLGYTIFLIAAGFHNSLILEPVSVLGASRFHRDLPVYLRNVFWGQLVLSLLLAALMAMAAISIPIGNDARIALLGAAILSPAMLTIWYLRRTQYLAGNPQKAMWVSLLYAAILVMVFGIAKKFGHMSALTGFSLIAVAAAVACLPFFRMTLVRGMEPCIRSVARAHWGFGKWFAAAPFLAVGTNHIQSLVVANFLGMEGIGVLRAAMNFALPVVQLATALSSLALPSLARTYNEHPEQFRASAGKLMLSYGASGFVYMVVLWFFGARMETLVYGAKFSANSGALPMIGVWIFGVCVNNAAGVVLRAMQAPRCCLVALVVASAFGFFTAKPLTAAYGVSGAAMSMAGTYIAGAIVQIVAYYRSR